MTKKTDPTFLKQFLDMYNTVIKPDLITRGELADLKNGVYDKMDAVYKEVLNMRAEQVAHFGSHLRVDEELENHNRRLKKLERPSVTAHSIKR